MFQVTRKVTQYVLIYKKISEILFQKSTFLPFIDWTKCERVLISLAKKTDSVFIKMN